jgi:hypothetical protein
MKIMMFLFVALLVVACASVKVEVTKSTAQPWSGGAAQQRGHNYLIQFSSNKELHLDSIYIGEYCFPLKETREAAAQYFWYKESDVYTVIVRHVEFQGRKTPGNKELEKLDCPPISFKGVAQIVYTESGSRGAFQIHEFSSISGVAYP